MSHAGAIMLALSYVATTRVSRATYSTPPLNHAFYQPPRMMMTSLTTPYCMHAAAAPRLIIHADEGKVRETFLYDAHVYDVCARRWLRLSVGPVLPNARRGACMQIVNRWKPKVVNNE